MKHNNFNVDMLLKSAMSSTETPDPELVQKVKYKQIKEESVLKKTAIRRSFSTVAAAVMAFVLITTTTFAAWYFLKPSEVANKFEDSALSAAFDSETAVNINESITSGDYTFTLLAIVSGKDISNHPVYYSGDIRSERTYAVVAIQKADGSSMPTTQDDEYGNPSFYVSPYIKGLKPWQVNAHTMKGGYSEMVVDGVMYRILDCDEVTMFADRGVYLGINTGSIGNHSEAFIFNEQTGELRANPDYDGSSVVFNLPIDKSLADPEKAQQYLETLWDVEDTSDAGEPIVDADSNVTLNLTGNGYISKQIMRYDTLKEWTDTQLEETQKKVDRGEYSKANMELDRQSFEEKLKDIEDGATVTLYLYEDGAYMLTTTYPDSGFDADVGASGGIVITN